MSYTRYREHSAMWWIETAWQVAGAFVIVALFIIPAICMRVGAK